MMCRLARILLSLVVFGIFVVGCTEEKQGDVSPTVTATAVSLADTPTPMPTALPTWTPVPTPVADVLYVDPTQQLGQISPLVYGTNYGPWITVPFDLLAQAESAGIRFLRFPGGNWGDENNLTERQLDQFMALSRQMGAEPQISVRLRGGTPEQAAALVQYTNIEKGYGVRYWSIGNEPSLYDDYDTIRYNQEWRQFAQAMRAVDTTILLIGPDTHQFTGSPVVDPTDANGQDWLRAFLEANGDMVDIVAVHRYPFPRSMNDVVTVADLRQNTLEWDSIVRNLRQTVRETTDRDLPIAITEANSHWSKAVGGEGTPDAYYNAIWWADSLGRMMNQGIDMVAHFALQSNDATGGWGLLARYEVRPAYYVYQLYQRFGQERLYAVSGVPDVSIYAAKRTDGAVTLLVINLRDEPVDVPVQVAVQLPVETAVLYRFDHEHNAENMGIQPFSQQQTLALPEQSISLFVIGGE